MITEIGIVAGEIWHFLDQHGETSLDNLTKGIERSRDTVLMSLGWLAREGHVVVNPVNGGYILNLRKNA